MYINFVRSTLNSATSSNSTILQSQIDTLLELFMRHIYIYYACVMCLGTSKDDHRLIHHFNKQLATIDTPLDQENFTYHKFDFKM